MDSGEMYKQKMQAYAKKRKEVETSVFEMGEPVKEGVKTIGELFQAALATATLDNMPETKEEWLAVLRACAYIIPRGQKVFFVNLVGVLYGSPCSPGEHESIGLKAEREVR